MRFWRLAVIPLVIMALLAWTGCGGGGNTYTPDPGPGDGQLPTGTWSGTVGTDAVTDPGFSGIPEIPFDSMQTSRAASEGDTGDPLVLLGSQFIQKYNAEVDGTSLVMAAPATAAEGDFAIAFGLYKFAGLQDKSPQWLNIECMPRIFGEEYYVGIADYTLGDWRWFGPVTFPEFQLDMRDIFHRFVTELGNMYFVVVCEAGNGATLSKSTLTVAEGGGEELLPGAPYHLEATDGAFEEMIVIEWGAGMGAGYYELWRRHDEGEWGKYAETEGTRYEDHDVVPGELYWYKAFSVNEHGRSEHSNVDSGYAGELGGEPSVHPPFDLVASDGLYEDKVRVEWEHEGDYSYFELWRKRDGEGFEWGKIAQTEAREHNDYQVDPGVEYIYKARAILDGHESEWSNHDAGWAAGGGGEQPPAPWELWASDGTHAEKVVVEWGYEGDAFFDVYRKLHEEGAEWEVIGETGDRHYYDWDAEPEVVYVYKVRAWVGGAESEDSNTDTGYAAGGGGVNPPFDLIATDGLYEDKVRVEWMMEGDYGYFDLWRKRDGEGFEWGRLATTEEAEYNDFEVDPGVEYIYKVRAIIGEQESDWSNHDVGWAGGGDIPPAPWELWATDGAHPDKVVVSWHYEIEGTWFDVYRKVSEEGSTWVVIDETPETHYYDYEVDAEVVYVYKVVPWVEGVQGEPSNSDTGYAAGGGTGPGTPYDLVASDGNYEDKVRVEWMMEGDYAYFDLWRKRDGEGFEWGSLALTEVAEYNDFEVDAGVHYIYKVRAILGEQEGEWSNQDVGWADDGGVPPAPWELWATDGAHADKVVVSWHYEIEGTCFDVYRRINEEGAEWSVIDETFETHYDDYEVDAEVVYVYKVVPWVEGVQGEPSNTDTGYAAGGGEPGTPFDLVASDGLYEEYVRIEWGMEGDYSNFDLWRKRDGEGYEWGHLAYTEDQEYNDEAVDPGVVYIYKVRAILGEQDGEWSNTDSGYAGDL